MNKDGTVSIRMADCHPDRKHAAKGLCRPCYAVANRKTRKRADCHPKRSHQARGLCSSCYERWLRNENPEYRERKRQYGKQWKLDNPEKVDKEGDHKRSLLRRYGLTEESYQQMNVRQNGVCAICGLDNQGGRSKNLDVDHDHETGEVRALLCNHCNSGLGKFRDDPNLLRLAANYLETFNANSTTEVK